MANQKQSNSHNLQVISVTNEDNDGYYNESFSSQIRVSKFDYSVENYFKAIDKIAIFSGESQFEYELSEIQRLSSSITFLRKWRDFCYQPRSVKFAREKETSQEKDVSASLNLPQFSSAAVPKDLLEENKISSPLSKDFVMYVGGHVWALDWCPRVHKSSDSVVNVEFIAISAHPPESTYHKIGAPLTGRGLIQIWCLLNAVVKDQDMVKPKKRSRNNLATKVKTSESNKPTKPRGRPRKYPVSKSAPKRDGGDQVMQDISVQSSENSDKLLQIVAVEEADKKSKSCNPKKSKRRPKKNPQPLAFAFPEDSPEMPAVNKLTLFTPETIATEDNNKYKDPSQILYEEGISSKTDEQGTLKVYKRRRKDCNKEYPAKSTLTSSKSTPTPLKPRLRKCKTRVKSQVNDIELPIEQDDVVDEHIHNTGLISEDVALPRLVMGLAHNGKVAWDVKWRPSDSNQLSKHIMGYLAVLLGNGALEVWEVPLPHLTKAIFSSCHVEFTDPRFLMFKPVFMCSKLKCGDRQSIPLTVEWSASAPHDLILAGCHDGVVALWRFTANGPSKDTRPLLCFSADTVPIRALKWAPISSDPESANIIVTAGHNGLKFWDIRDPFHALWDIPTQRIINSLDWLPDPSCVVLSFDDGEIRITSLLKAACDVPATGIPCVKTQQHGSHSYYCPSSSIWSVQVSKLTGMVAYCCSDGKVIHFQLTSKVVEKDPNRNREPHYLCGSVAEEESTLTVFSPLPDVPYGDTPRSKRGYISNSNQKKRVKDEKEKQPSGTLTPAQKSITSKTKPKTKTSQSLVCVDDDNKNEEDNAEEERNANEAEKEVFPPKIVAMHRVRWNMNKGSERLLCYGGAAGIVRCQEIS